MDLILESIWLFREHQFSQARQELGSAQDSVESLRQQLRDSRSQIAHANLAIVALWELQQEKSNLTTDQVKDKMVEIQGRTTTSENAAPCLGCGRGIPAQHEKCLYCGNGRIPAGMVGVLK